MPRTRKRQQPISSANGGYVIIKLYGTFAGQVWHIYSHKLFRTRKEAEKWIEKQCASNLKPYWVEFQDAVAS